jgi:hypothetical protein
VNFYPWRLTAGNQVLSSNVMNAGVKDRCLTILRQISHMHGILPKSYYLPQVILSDSTPYSSGRFADIWKGQLDGRQVGIKAFRLRTQEAEDLDEIKQVRGRVPHRG